MKRTFVQVFRTGLIAGAFVSCASLAQAADVSTYAVQKGAIYSQTSAAAPTSLPESPFVFRAEVEGDIGAIFDAQVRTPIGADLVLQPDDSGSVLQVETPMPSLSALNTIAPNGTYNFIFDTENEGDTIAQLTLATTVFPTAIPQISNFAAIESIDPDADFTLNFNSFGNDDGTERWEFTILESGFPVFMDSGAGGSVTIPAGTLFLDSTFEGRLRFVREVANDMESYPGAIGTIEIYNETRFDLSTGEGGGGGGDDTTAPMLFFSNPTDGTEDVPRSTQVTFVFNEPMAPTQSIEWSANLNAANFNYTWMQDSVLMATYSGGFPAGAVITWTLNPTAGNAANFRDVAGNLLPVDQFQGSFTVAQGGGDPNDPCDPNGDDDGRGGGSIFKSLNYVQTSNAAPVPDPEFTASASVFYSPGTNQVVSTVRIATPNGTEELTGLFGNWFASEEFANGTELETAFPAGNYTLTVEGTGGGSATLALGNTTQLPVPQITNLEQFKAANPTTDFTLTFAPFTGAGANDSIFIEIASEDGENEFMAPDMCVPRDLPNTATSVVIPANTFVQGQTYRGSITFSRMSFDTNSIPNTWVTAGISVRTSFDFTTGGTPTNQPTWGNMVRNPNGTITFTIQGDAGASITVEGSDSPASGWSEVASGVLTGGSFEYTIDPALASKRFLRARID